MTDQDDLAALMNEAERCWRALFLARPDDGLREALIAIRDMEPEPFDTTIHHDPNACDDCKRYIGHPISNGHCDVWAREFDLIERQGKDAYNAQVYRMRRLARVALAGDLT